MKLFAAMVCVGSAIAADSNPFLGRWDFTTETKTGNVANWLGVKQQDGALLVTFQPSGGNVAPVKDYKLEGSHLTLNFSRGSATRPAMTWELDAKGDTLTGFQIRGGEKVQLAGMRAPELNRNPPKAWTSPEPLFNGKNLEGWEPIGNPAASHWVVSDGLLVNQEHGANLKTTRKFGDFKVHFEVNCPDRANSGFYLRGRYEVQLEYEPVGSEPPERRMGSVYGRIAPKELPRKPSEWESFDITLVGRTVTIVRDGVTTVDAQQIEGITGGALDAHEGEPGPFYIQGDHTGGLKFRNITIAIPKS